MREDWLDRLGTPEEPAPDDTKDRIRAAREAERTRRAEAKLTPGQKKHRRKVAKTVEQEERARQKRVAERDALIAEAVDMLTERLGDDLPAFVVLFKKVDTWCLRSALENAVA